MLSLCISHVTTIASLFPSSVFHFRAKLSKICELFFSCEKKNNEVRLVTQEYKHIKPQKRWFDGTNRSLSVRVMNKSSRYTQQIIVTQAGTMKLGLWVIQLSKFSSYPSFTVYLSTACQHLWNPDSTSNLDSWCSSISKRSPSLCGLRS